MNFLVDYFLFPLSPVLSLVAAGVGLIAAECFPRWQLRSFKLGLALLGTAVSFACVFWIWSAQPLAFSTGYFGDAAWLTEFTHSFRLDAMTLGFFAAIAGFTFLSLIFLASHFTASESRTEILALTLFIASGMMMLVSADSLLMVFLALELLSLPTYVLVGIQRKDRNSCEAALKYFLFGSFATVLLVFGIALLYGHFGTMEIPKITEALKAHDQALTGTSRVLVFAGMALLLIAVTFKIGVVPFHMWLPDAYQGAPTPVTAFMGSAIKLAGFGLAVRLLWGMFLPLAGTWVGIVNCLALVTMFVGNLAALAQDNLKRMFAYSSISHAGYLLLGVGTITKYGPNANALYYYLVIYGLMFLGFFALLALIEKQTKSNDIYQISGLGFSHPLLGGCLALFALSAAGIPPTAGFIAKYFIFLEAVRAGHTFLVVLAVMSSLIGAYYYLRVVVYLYMKETKERLTFATPSWLYWGAVLACAGSLLVFAVCPELLSLR